MTTTGLLRIAFRWKWPGLTAFGAILIGGLILAATWPLKYDAQITIEREPAKISFRPLDSQFDVTRFTSENQRTIALLRSRYLTQQWLDAIGIRPSSAKATERALKKLSKSLIVKPVNFTDLYLIKVQADTPSEAKRRAELLVSLFEKWDATEVQESAQRLINLLQRRLDTVGEQLAADRMRMKREKLDAMLNLSGSVVQAGIETRLKAKQELYNELTDELEKVERQIDPASVGRVRIAIPVTAAETPLRSRGLLIVIAFAGSLFAGLSTVLLLEWQSRKIFRLGDLYRHIGSRPVITIPDVSRLNGHEINLTVVLGPLLEAIGRIRQAKGSAVVQIISPDSGDGKSSLCEWLQHCMQDLKWRPCILQGNVYSNGGSGGLEDHLNEARAAHDVVLVELPLPVDNVAGTNLTQAADITCVVVRAAKTTSDVLPLVAEQLKRFPQQIAFFVLNQFRDPLPASIRN